jgi:hypothetical protein
MLGAILNSQQEKTRMDDKEIAINLYGTAEEKRAAADARSAASSEAKAAEGRKAAADAGAVKGEDGAQRDARIASVLYPDPDWKVQDKPGEPVYAVSHHRANPTFAIVDNSGRNMFESQAEGNPDAAALIAMNVGLLQDANLRNRDLEKVVLDSGDLSRANLRDSKVGSARWANLQHTDLRGCTLDDVSGADLRLALIDSSTRLGNVQGAIMDEGALQRSADGGKTAKGCPKVK